MDLLGTFVKSSIDGVVIELDKGNTPYVAGEKVTGFVHITTQKDDIKVAKIILEVTGQLYTKVPFTEKTKAKKGEKAKSKKAVAQNNETFFSQSIIIEGSEKLLPQGNSKYKFEFLLPEEARSSLSSEFASVSYTMKCTADVMGLMGLDATGSLDLWVTRVRDLNEEIESLEDADGQMETTVGCGCFKQGPISLNVRIPKSGFVSGETAKVDVKVSNMTKKMIKSTSLELVQHVKRQAQGKWGTDSEDIMDPVDLGAVEPAAEKTFSHDFRVPESHVSSQPDDPDIVVTYSLLVNVEPDVTFFRSVLNN